MTFKEMQDLVLGTRFTSGQRTAAKSWINSREVALWNQDGVTWEFAYPDDYDADVTAGVNTLSVGAGLPADLDDVLRLTRDDGCPLKELNREDFDLFRIRLPSLTSGTPWYYTVVNRSVVLAPTPDVNATYTLAYSRRLCHFDGDDDVVAGVMVEDDDYPVYPDEFHGVLVPGAVSTGLKYENDPTWSALEEEYGTLTQAMMGACHVDLLAQYGRAGCD